MYDKKLLRAYNSKSFVISIGNITTIGCDILITKIKFNNEVFKLQV